MPSCDMPEPLKSLSTTCNVTCKSKSFLFSLEEGMELVCQILQDLWPHKPQDYQIEAVAKVLDGVDVLAILPTGADKTAILMTFILVLIHMKSNLEDFTLCCSQFLDDPIMIVVYPTNCLKEEQVSLCSFRDKFIQ